MTEKTTYRVIDTHPFTGAVKSRAYDVYTRDEARELFVNEHYPDTEEDTKKAIKAFLRVQYEGGPMNEPKTTRCVQCASEFSEHETENANACPACGDKGVPMSISEDVTVKINWHELRILSIWAENWARKIQKDDPRSAGSLLTIMSIAGRLQNQHPDKAKLTLFSEVRELREHVEKTGIASGIQTNIDNDDDLGV